MKSMGEIMNDLDQQALGLSMKLDQKDFTALAEYVYENLNMVYNEGCSNKKRATNFEKWISETNLDTFLEWLSSGCFGCPAGHITSCIHGSTDCIKRLREWGSKGATNDKL